MGGGIFIPVDVTELAAQWKTVQLNYNFTCAWNTMRDFAWKWAL